MHAIQILQNNRSNLNDFGKSLLSQFEDRGYLSDRQWFFVEKIAKEIATPKPVAPSTDMTGIVALMHLAQSHLKFPKIRLALENGQPVVLSVAGPNARRPGTINVTDGGSFGANEWYGRISTDGQFEPAQKATPEVIALLVEMAAHPARTASEYGKRHGNCCFCGRGLNDERSLTVGYGPICADHYGLPWGEAAHDFVASK